jgi:hypothetical protein
MKKIFSLNLINAFRATVLMSVFLYAGIAFVEVAVHPLYAQAQYSDFASCMADNDYNDVKCCNINKEWSQCKVSSNGGSVNKPPVSGGAGGGAGAGNGATKTCTPGSCGEGFCYENGLCIPKSPISGTPESIVNSSSVMEIILKVLKILLTIVGVIAVLLIIVGGFQYITSGGNEEQAEKGKKAILNALIGLVVVVLSYAIVSIIVKTLTNGIGV